MEREKSYYSNEEELAPYDGLNQGLTFVIYEENSSEDDEPIIQRYFISKSLDSIMNMLMD